MTDIVKLAQHSGILAITVFSLYYDYYYVDLSKFSPKNDIQFYKGRLKFLTLWNMLLQALFFTICVINDIVGTNEYFPKNKVFIRRLKDMIFASLAFPLSLFVSLTFWALYAVDRELVLPRAIDPYFPTWLNHCMHTNILVFILAELFTTYRTYPARRTCITILSAVMLTYLAWVHVIHSYTGAWVYPVLDVLELPMRLVFFVGLLGLAGATYGVGEWCNGVVWRGVKKGGSGKRRKSAKGD